MLREGRSSRQDGPPCSHYSRQEFSSVPSPCDGRGKDALPKVSKATDASPPIAVVRVGRDDFTSECGHSSAQSACPLCAAATTGHIGGPDFIALPKQDFVSSERSSFKRVLVERQHTNQTSIQAPPVTIGSPAARHSGRPSSNRRTLKPRARSAATA